MRFYGFTLEYVNNIELDEFNKMITAMERIKARESLNMMSVVSYPKLTNKGRNELHRELFKKAYPENFDKRVVKNDDLKLV